MQASSNRTVLQSQASDRRKQNACFSAVLRRRVGSATARKSILAVVASSALLGAGNQDAALVMRDGYPKCYATWHDGRSPS